MNDKADTLTRIWCVFELFQTIELKGPGGLLLCTSTCVLKTGNAGVDMVANMVRKLSKVKIEDAQASKKSDKATILDQVKPEVAGGCDALNKVVILHLSEGNQPGRED